MSALERCNSDALTQLESRLTTADDRTTASARADLVALESGLREDLRQIDAAIRLTDETFASRVTSLEACITEIERRLGLRSN